MTDHGNSLSSGQYRNLLGSVVKAVPYSGIPSHMLPYWADRSCALERKLRHILSQELDQEENNDPILRDITGDHILTLPASDGGRIIADARETFRAGIDPDFRNWGAYEPGRKTAKTRVRVYELIQNADFIDMFWSQIPLPGGAEILRRNHRLIQIVALEQHQIIDFANIYPNWLRHDGSATFIPFWSNAQAFVADARVYPAGLRAFADRLEFSDECYADDRYRVVLPELV